MLDPSSGSSTVGAREGSSRWASGPHALGDERILRADSAPARERCRGSPSRGSDEECKVFPDPDEVGWKGRDGPLTIWRYGNIELHFADHLLYMVFSDYVATLDGGPSIVLDRWVLGDSAQRTLAAMMRALTTEKIDFATRNTSIGQVE